MPAEPDFFDDAYHRLIAPFHPEEETRQEVASIRELLALSQEDAILDLGCGWGRHMRLMREIGHQVIGVDLSPALLRRAVGEGGGGGGGGAGDTQSLPAPPVVAADMRRLPFAGGSFDAVLNLATSLGLFLDDRDLVAALSEARRVLGEGGRLLIEGMHRDDVVANYAERDCWTMDDGTAVRVRRRFDAVRGVSHEVMRWRGPGHDGTKRHSLRLRTAIEMIGLVEAAGFGVVVAYGGWEMEPLGRQSERLILVAG
jgi:SAM-dependent methyltransferase